jgi:hypothetical protein
MRAIRVRGFPAVALALAAAPVAAQTTGGCGMSAANGTALADPAGADVGKMVQTLEHEKDESPEAQRWRREEMQAYRENLRVRREQAEQYAAAVRNGAPLPADASETLRAELAADIEQWRAEFGVGRKEWQAMRDEWLVARDSLTAAQWAQRRVDWWTARDSWVADHRR